MKNNYYFKALALLVFLFLFSCSKEDKPHENRPPGIFEIESIQYENQKFFVSWKTPNDPDQDLIKYDIYIDDEKKVSETKNTSYSGTLPYNSIHSGRIIASDKNGGHSELTFNLEMPKSKILFFNAEDMLYALDIRTQKLLWKSHMIALINDLHSIRGDQIFVHYDQLTSRNILTGEVTWTKESNDKYGSHFILTDGEAIFRKINYSAFERLNRNNGSTEWTIHTLESKGPAGLDDQYIYLTDRSAPALRVYDKITGKQKWTFSIPDEFGGENYYNQIGHTPVTSNDKVFIRTGYGYLFALSREMGDIIWHDRLTTKNIPNFKGNETRPLIYGDELIVIANSGVYSVNQNTGNLNWQIETGSHIYSSPFLYENNIYFTSDEYLFCMNVTSGSIKWKQSLPTHIQISPIVYDDLIFVGGNDYFFAFHVEDGSEAWRFHTDAYASTSPSLVIGESEKIIYPTINPSTN